MNNEWTVEARCPHGYSVRLPFDALGYIMKPSDESCSPHRPVTKTAHGVTVTSPDQPTLSRFAIWRE
jgi:hypothetical protein